MRLGIKTKILAWAREFFPQLLEEDPSLNNLSKELKPYLDKENGNFIEVGGNDGHTQSNTYYYAKKYGWKGVLVEAVPRLYKKCEKLRKESRVFNYALVAHDFKSDSIEIYDSNLMSTIDGSLGDYQKQHLENSKKYNTQQISKIKVPARTLESILDEVGINEYDFMSLDVEGYEAEVLKGMNIKKWRPKYILIEVREMDSILDVLKDNYTMVKQLSHHDYLFKRTDL